MGSKLKGVRLMGNRKSFLTGMGGPGDQPGIARNAAAGPMDAGSDAVATTRTTIFSDSPPPPALLLAASKLWFRWWFVNFWGKASRRSPQGWVFRGRCTPVTGQNNTGRLLERLPERLMAEIELTILGCVPCKSQTSYSYSLEHL